MALNKRHGPKNGGCKSCRGVVTVSQTDGNAIYNLGYYALGQISKFVPYGAQRVGSNTFGDNNIQDVVFENPDGSHALIAYNASSNRKKFTVKWGDRSFSYSLNPGAAVTFTWTGKL
jgi:glucosylceramidase